MAETEFFEVVNWREVTGVLATSGSVASCADALADESCFSRVKLRMLFKI